MELMRFTGGHFFTTPFQSTRLKGELDSLSKGKCALQKSIPQEMKCENFSMLTAVSFGARAARTYVPRDSGPS
jgi:hypothetical protein